MQHLLLSRCGSVAEPVRWSAVHASSFPQESFSAALAEVQRDIQQRAAAAFDPLEGRRLSAQHSACDQLTASVEQAYKHEVPALVQRLVGPARSEMQTAHESFEVENAKVRAREARLVDTMEAWGRANSQRMGWEQEDRESQLAITAEQLTGDLLYPVRVERDHQRQVIMPAVREVKEGLEAETTARREADTRTVQGMAAATEKLQEVVLDNFGAGTDDEGSDDEGDGSASDSD